MPAALFAGLLYDADAGRTFLRALPVLVGVLGVLAIAYRFYSAFLAARVACLDDSRVTPAHRFNDGSNYHPTNKWVLFGHHFAAISGAGPLIGPVLALQYGYAPGLFWLIIGVCLAGAVQDMLVLAASVRHDGKSLAEIARAEIGRPAAAVVSAAILFIVIIALAGLGFVIVKALGGEEVKLGPERRVLGRPEEPTRVTLPEGKSIQARSPGVYEFPGGCTLAVGSARPSRRPESFLVVTRPYEVAIPLAQGDAAVVRYAPPELTPDAARTVTLPPGSVQRIPGSSWGTFTIACTIPIALFVGWYIYRLRPGRVLEGSLIGAALVLGATFLGGMVPGSPLQPFFDLSRGWTIIALGVYGVIASVLPVWLLLGPRDYLSSFLKIGTIALLVGGLMLANPRLNCPPINQEFIGGGPTFQGSLFPFVFICVMCGAISGFHSLVSSGTTPKMIDREGQVRAVGYGAMLLEGLVGVVALLAAAALPPDLYYGINVEIDRVPMFQEKLERIYTDMGFDDAARDRMHAAGVRDAHAIDLGELEERVGGEALRGRTGGAVTLAAGMAVVFTDALQWTGLPVKRLTSYWFHFAIMFEALFILTTIDAGTRISRFLLQETLGSIRPAWGRPDWWPGALGTSVAVTLGWTGLVWTGSIGTIWPMFGIANQLLAVLALALVTTWLVNTGRGRYAWVTLLPMAFVTTTTLTAASQMVTYQFPALAATGKPGTAVLNTVLTVFVVVSVCTLLVMAASRWLGVAGGMIRTRPADAPPPG